nr:2-hydroxymuconate tautomerase [uncultured Holophaga sp.]
MPIVQISLLEGRTADQKRKVAADVTEAIMKHMGAPADAVRVIFQDMAPVDYAVGGVLHMDKK